MHLLGIVVTAPVLLVVLPTVAIVHVSIEHQARRRPGTLDEQQFAVFVCGEEKTLENVSKGWLKVIKRSGRELTYFRNLSFVIVFG